ncbi:MAG: hypothetical protein OK452_11525, partial [Thaumarchaeota archaeon]|nr:hypothetical protein [Nitrososphaerota archaeon]
VLTFGGGTVASGDVIVVTVGVFNGASSTCDPVFSIGDTLAGSWSGAPGTVSSANAAASSPQCSYNYINYKTAGAGGGDTITITLTSTTFSSAVVVAYDLTGFTTPPSGGFVVGSSTIAGCNNAGGCGNPVAMTTGSLTYVASSFLIASGDTCQSTSGGGRAITAGVAGFANTYGPGNQQYVGYNIPASGGSTTFGMTADTGANPIACWTEIGAQFLDPPSPTPSVSMQASSPYSSVLTAQFTLAWPVGLWADLAILSIGLLWMEVSMIALSTRLNKNGPGIEKI